MPRLRSDWYSAPRRCATTSPISSTSSRSLIAHRPSSEQERRVGVRTTPFDERYRPPYRSPSQVLSRVLPKKALLGLSAQAAPFFATDDSFATLSFLFGAMLRRGRCCRRRRR